MCLDFDEGMANLKERHRTSGLNPTFWTLSFRLVISRDERKPSLPAGYAPASCSDKGDDTTKKTKNKKKKIKEEEKEEGEKRREEERERKKRATNIQ